MSKRVAICAIALLSATSANSANCDSIISHGLRNISISRSEEASIALKYYNRCEINAESYSESQLAEAEVEIFGYGSGGGKYSAQQRRDRINNWCQANQDIAASNKKSLSETQTIYQGAVSAWETCVRLNDKSIQIIPIISPDAKTVDIGIVYKGDGDSGVRLTGMPTENFTCTATFPDNDSEISFPYTVGNRAVQVRCIRAEAELQSINGTDFYVTPRATIAIQTASEPFQLYFAEEWAPPAPEAALASINKRVDTLEARLASLELIIPNKSGMSDLKALKDAVNVQLEKLSRWGDDLGDKQTFTDNRGNAGFSTDRNEGRCADGGVVTGLQLGGHRLIFRCRKLPVLSIDD